MIRVLVAEDMVVLLDAVASLLDMETDIAVVSRVSHGDDVLEQAKRTKPDVLVLDVDMPGMGGLEIAARARTELPDSKVLLLTALDRPGIVARAWGMGVMGFLSKAVSTARLADGVRKVYKGELDFSNELLTAARTEGNNPLTPREQRICRLVLQGRSTGDIADELHIRLGTLRNHNNKIIAKAKETHPRPEEVRNIYQAARIVDERGWL